MREYKDIICEAKKAPAKGKGGQRWVTMNGSPVPISGGKITGNSAAAKRIRGASGGGQVSPSQRLADKIDRDNKRLSKKDPNAPTPKSAGWGGRTPREIAALKEKMTKPAKKFNEQEIKDYHASAAKNRKPKFDTSEGGKYHIAKGNKSSQEKLQKLLDSDIKRAEGKISTAKKRGDTEALKAGHRELADLKHHESKLKAAQRNNSAGQSDTKRKAAGLTSSSKPLPERASDRADSYKSLIKQRDQTHKHYSMAKKAGNSADVSKLQKKMKDLDKKIDDHEKREKGIQSDVKKKAAGLKKATGPSKEKAGSIEDRIRATKELAKSLRKAGKSQEAGRTEWKLKGLQDQFLRQRSRARQ